MTKIEFIFQQTKGYRIQFFLLFLFVIASSIIGTFYPFYLGRMIDSVLYQYNFKEFFISFAFYGVVFFLHQLVWFFHTRLVARLRASFLFNIKINVLRKVLSYKASSLADLESGDIIHRLENDSDQIMDYIYYNVIYTISDIFELLTQLVFIYLINWKLLLLTLVAMPVSFFFVTYFSKKVKNHYKEVNKEQNAFSAWLFDILNGLRDIKLFNAGHRIIKILVQKKSHIIRNDIKAQKIEIASETSISAVSFLIQMSLYFLSAILIVIGNLTIGGFIAVVEYFNASLSAFRDIFGRANPITQNLVSIERVVELFSIEGEQTNLPPTEISPHEISGDIKFENITFAYEDQKVLENISFHIKNGEKVAIVGHSGSGKSTLINLLLRLYDADEGQIYLDDCNIKNYDVHALRNHIGVVHQNNVLFQGTIRFNLQFSEDKESDDLLWDVLQYVELKDFIMSLPNKLDTWIGRSGIDMSGGQRQRLTIARLYLRNPSVLIFDEATSSLDSDTEKNIIQCLNEIYSKKTLIIIAHRLSTILKADKVLLLNNGKVEAFGTHESLLKDNIIYSQLFSSQIIGGQ